MRKDNVQFSIAVHVMTILAYMNGKEIISSRLAASVNTSPSFVRRILSKLSKAGLVKATAGKNGSCVINRSSSDVTLLDIYRALGAPSIFSIHNYPSQPLCPVSCRIKPLMQKIAGRAQKLLEKTLEDTKLSDLVKDVKKK